jgi:MFS transporter, NNP family, nitrate/nitrite transporter
MSKPETTGATRSTAGTAPPGTTRPGLMLGLATAGFAVNFWAWALLSPLGPKFKDVLHLTPIQQALVVAVPVVVGSLGRIPVGALTDRYGGRIMFPLVSLATIVPVLYLGLSGHSSLAGLLVGGFFLGIGGTAFAVGVPFVSAWFPSQPLSRRLADTARLRVTWQAAALYAVLFGGYVAFSVYLPAYLKTAYGLTQADAANRMAGFVPPPRRPSRQRPGPRPPHRA